MEEYRKIVFCSLWLDSGGDWEVFSNSIFYYKLDLAYFLFLYGSEFLSLKLQVFYICTANWVIVIVVSGTDIKSKLMNRKKFWVNANPGVFL